MIPSYSDRNRGPANGGPSGVQRSYASQLRETEPLFHTYEHLQGLDRADAALTMLRKVASLVKPIMRKRNWRVQVLAEFLPSEANLLGLNVNKGYKICLRLRFHNNPDLFLPLEQVVDTMLHELSHNVWGEHDSNFHKLWDELRDEHETLLRKGYTGEGFLSEGHRLGGGGRYGTPPTHEMRRLARASAEKRLAQKQLTKGSGQRLGGTPLHELGGDIRHVIADQIERRNTINKGCGSSRADAIVIADDASKNTFKTKSQEDDANDRAIAQALFELMEQEESRKLQNGTFSSKPTDGGLAWSPETGLYDPNQGQKPSPIHPTEEEQLRWAMEASTSSPPNSNSNGVHTGPTHGWSPVSPLTPERDHDSASIGSALSSPPPIPNHSKPMSNGYGKPEQTTAQPNNPSSTPHDVPNRQDTPTAKPPVKQYSIVHSPVAIDLSDPFDPTQWTCSLCTCINPMQFLACDACGSERPHAASFPPAATTARRSPLPSSAARTMPVAALAGGGAAAAREPGGSLGWNCVRCGAFMEHRWWTCSACGLMKSSS